MIWRRLELLASATFGCSGASSGALACCSNQALITQHPVEVREVLRHRQMYFMKSSLYCDDRHHEDIDRFPTLYTSNTHQAANLKEICFKKSSASRSVDSETPASLGSVKSVKTDSGDLDSVNNRSMYSS